MEVYILDDLSQRNLALSYRYYDPIMKIIFNKMSNDCKHYFTKKTNKSLRKMKEDDIWYKFKNRLIDAVL